MDASVAVDRPASAALWRRRVAATTRRLHDRLTRFFEQVDGQARFREDAWARPEGGGGHARVLTDGAVFEKVGVNRAEVEGPVTPQLARALALGEEPEGLGFFAVGVSIVAHPHSPCVPIVHENVRYFELSDARGRIRDRWFGGGLDLTPTLPHPEDAVHFHRTLRDVCSPFGPALYPLFKQHCDRYFVNRHRDDEARGIGGIFYDHVRPGDHGLDADRLLELMRAVGESLEVAYGPVVERRAAQPWGDEEKALQLHRRGRYVEFNLLHDRGTRFGLDSGARTESVLMSLPPTATWAYAPQFEAGSLGARLQEMLVPRDWAALEAEDVATRIRGVA
ncbi:MAG: oxygen-dependent coproporphyrinogen oxidase [Gemmatimonadota bacterium]